MAGDILVLVACVFGLCKENIIFSYYSEAGLSSNMEHKFCENYSENILPVEDKGCCLVRPFANEENTMTRPMVSAKQCKKAQIFFMRSESDFAEHSKTLTEARKMAFPPQATWLAVPEEGLKEDTLSTLPGTTAISEKLPDMEISADIPIMNKNMDTQGNSAEPKGPLLVREKRRNSSQKKKRPDGKKWKCNYNLIYIDLK